MDNRIRLSVYEDEVPQLDLLRSLFQYQSSIELNGAYSDCAHAVEQTAIGKPDVVLMDIMFGTEPKGVQALIGIKSAFPDTDVVMFTSKEDSDLVFECIKQGASGYIKKNESLGLLLEYVRMIHEGGTVFSASIGTKVRDYFQQLHQSGRENTYALTSREVEALTHLCNGLSKKMIADRMGIGIHGVAQHLRHVFEKLQVHTATEAVAKALRERLV